MKIQEKVLVNIKDRILERVHICIFEITVRKIPKGSTEEMPIGIIREVFLRNSVFFAKMSLMKLPVEIWD